jgi:hypothetical protein
LVCEQKKKEIIRKNWDLYGEEKQIGDVRDKET